MAVFDHSAQTVSANDVQVPVGVMSSVMTASLDGNRWTQGVEEVSSNCSYAPGWSQLTTSPGAMVSHCVSCLLEMDMILGLHTLLKLDREISPIRDLSFTSVSYKMTSVQISVSCKMVQECVPRRYLFIWDVQYPEWLLNDSSSFNGPRC